MPECEQIQKARFFSTNPVDCEQGHDPVFQHRTNGRMTPPAEFTYNGHQVEIVPPDTAHLIGNYWQIKIDGVIRGNFLFSSARMAAEEAKKLIDTGSFP